MKLRLDVLRTKIAFRRRKYFTGEMIRHPVAFWSLILTTFRRGSYKIAFLIGFLPRLNAQFLCLLFTWVLLPMLSIITNRLLMLFFMMFLHEIIIVSDILKLNNILCSDLSIFSLDYTDHVRNESELFVFYRLLPWIEWYSSQYSYIWYIQSVCCFARWYLHSRFGLAKYSSQ